MPRITVKTNVFLNREKKYRMTLDKEIFVQVLARMTETVMKYTQIPEDRIFAYYRNSPLWTYKRQDIIGTLVHV